MRSIRDTEMSKLYYIKAQKGKDKLATSIYARKSREDTHGTSLPIQIDECKALINTHSNLLNISEEHIFQEDNASGMSFEQRTEFKKMIEAVESGEIDVVVVSKYDRFSRDTADLANLGKLFDKHQAYLIAGDDLGDNSAVGMLMKQIFWATSEFHVRRSAEDVMKVQIEQARSGLTPGGIPSFGYRVVNRKYEIDPLEAVIVEKIFDLYLEGSSYYKIIEELSNSGYSSRSGKDFSLSMINSILTNERNCGIHKWNRQDRKKHNLNVLKEVFDEVICEDTVIEAIVSKEKFNRVQELLVNKATPRSGTKNDFLLSGLITCCVCGQPLVGNSQKGGRSGNRYTYYICRNHKSKSLPKCATKDTQTQYLDKLVIDQVFSLIQSSLSVDEISSETVSASLEDAKRTISRLNRQINLINGKLEDLALTYASSKSASIKTATEKAINSKTSDLTELEKHKKETQSRFDAIKKNVEHLNDGEISKEEMFSNLNISRRIISTLIKSISVSNGDIVIEYN